MASPTKKPVLLDVNVKRAMPASPPKIAMKLAGRAPSPQKTAQQLFEKLEAAEARRDVELEEKKFKAQAMATMKGTVKSSPTKAEVDARMKQAQRNHDQFITEKVEQAAQETMKLEQARERRELLEKRSREVAAIQYSAKETDAERRLLGLEIQRETKRLVTNNKREKVYERLAEDRERRAALLDEKLERAAELKGQHDDLTRLRAAATSTCRVAAAQTRRDVDDAERRLHAAAETANKMEDAQRRREIEQLDKVVRAASLGSAAVVTAARRRLRDTDQQMETGARNLEIKLTGAELERRRKLEDVAAKARATGTARVEAAAQERKYREDRAEMDAEYRRNQARLASSRAEDAKMLVAGKASMANAEKMRRRQEKEKMESDFCEETRAKLDAKLQDAEKRVEQEGLRLRTKYQGVRREAPPPSDGPDNYFAEHGVLIGGCVAGGLAAVFALSRVLARFS